MIPIKINGQEYKARSIEFDYYYKLIKVDITNQPLFSHINNTIEIEIGDIKSKVLLRSYTVEVNYHKQTNFSFEAYY